MAVNLVIEGQKLTDLETPLVAVPVFSDGGASGADFAVLDAAAGGRLKAIATEERFGGESGKTLLVHTPDLGAKRVLLVGVGPAAEFQPLEQRKFAATAAEEATRRKLPGFAVALGGADARAIRHATEGVLLGLYRYDTYLTVDVEPRSVERAALVVTPGADLGALEPAMHRARRASEGVLLARDLINGPPTEVTPRRLAEVAEEIARDERLEVTILDEAQIRDRGMNLLLAVSAGSEEPPRFIHLTYRPEGADATTPQVALVGKGLPFDAGGYNLKPTGSMEDMKVDMSGAAAVLGAMKAVRAFAPRVVVHGIIPSSENLVSGRAYKPGDIIRSLNCKTVEIMNSDAEGRLILADALAYAEKLGVQKIVDLATLTGACMIALGPHIAGLFANDDAWRAAVQHAAERAGEDVWPLPLSKKLRAMLKSPIADMKNIGERWGGAITGGLFLQEFVGKTAWAHLDIAGPASSDKPEPGVPKGGTGFGVLTLLELLANEV